MTPKIGIHLIFGSNPEPFLEAALQSVAWVDYVCAVNTAPEDGIAGQNEAIVRRVVPREKLRLEHVHSSYGKVDFAKARNKALDLADDGDFVFILDSDDVHYPELEDILRYCVTRDWDIITAHFWHLIGYKDRWGQEPHREFCFKKVPGVRFEKEVHESLEHPREHPTLLPDYHYVHYGYIKPPREIFKRWVLYSEIEGDPDHYQGQNPDDALAGWLENTHPFWRDHPPAVVDRLRSYPEAPRSVDAIEAVPNIGLVLLTWNDAANLGPCLKSLASTRQPFKLLVIDNGSTDDTLSMVVTATGEFDDCQLDRYPEGLALAAALNIGFEHFMRDPDIDYIGWIHPDMVFEKETWLECLRHCLDTHPDIAKVGAHELETAPMEDPTPGNSQCYIIRKTALEQVGLFDERFEACGGYEDWEHNYRLLQAGRVMIWPDAHVSHKAMGTRKNHDNEDAARRNADLYHQLVGQWEAVV